MSWSRRDHYNEMFSEGVKSDCKIYHSTVQGILESISNIEDMIMRIPFYNKYKFKKIWYYL